MPEPQILIFREQQFDPTIEDYVDVEMPTETIKKFRRVSGPSSHRTIASYTGLGNQKREEGGSFDCIGRVTRITINSTRGTLEFHLVDRSGTFDEVLMVTAGRVTLQGYPSAPICNVKGTFKVTMGSVTAGTFTAAFELLKRIPGTFTVR